MNFVGIDPATKTGFVRIDLEGKVLKEKSVTCDTPLKGGITIEQLVSLKNGVRKLLNKEDIVMLELGLQTTYRAFTTGMIHGTLRIQVLEKCGSFLEVAPSQLKKYVGLDTKVKASTAIKKKLVASQVKNEYGFTHESHDVVDAYMIAIINRDYYLYTQGIREFEKNKLEVLESIYAKKNGIQLKPKKPKKPKERKPNGTQSKKSVEKK